MRAILPILALLTACQTSRASQLRSPAPVQGASSARAAVDLFMTGMKTSDVQAVGNVWGTRDWLVRDHYPRAEFEKRVLIASCYIGWDGYQITAEQPVADQALAVTIKSTTPGQEQQTVVRTEENSRGRWFVEGFDIQNLRPIRCS